MGCVALGDNWNMAVSLAKHLSRRIKSLSKAPATREEMFRAIAERNSTFISSPFCNPNTRIDLIVGGFSDKEPLLVCTGFDGGNPYAAPAGDVAVVGSGSSIASAFLKIRGANRNMTKDRAVYAAYEAKKYSENAPSVDQNNYLDSKT